MTVKTCRMCGEIKPASSFRKRVDISDGLYSYCKPCARKAERQRLQRHPWHFAQTTCDQIAARLEWKINDFESRTGLEAPPQLTAMLQLARSYAEQKIPTRNTGSCKHCGGSTAHKPPNAMFCSRSCQEKAKYLRHKAAAA